MLGYMGNSHWKMPCIDLHGMSLVVVVFLVVEIILYVELSVETWSCWIACGNTVVLVEWTDCVWKHCTRRLKYLSLDIFSLLFFGNNSVRRIIVLVCRIGFDHMFSLLKRCKYSLYSDTMLNYWSTNHCWTQLDTRSVEQTKDVRMYIEEFILVDIWIHCCTWMKWVWNLMWNWTEYAWDMQ